MKHGAKLCRLIALGRLGPLWVLLLAAAIHPAVGQERAIRFDHLDVGDGLTPGAVRAIFQDRIGFLWIGTDEGLTRYDGRGFTVYRHDPEAPGSLSDDAVWAIQEDREGRLWVATYGGGLNRWDAREKRFESWRHHPSDPLSLSDDRVTALSLDLDGAIWIGTEGGGLNRLDPVTGELSRIAGSEGPYRIDSILKRGDGSLWLGTFGRGLIHFDPGTGKLVRYRNDPGDAGSLASDEVTSLLEDREGRLWVGTTDGLHRRERDGGFRRFRHDASSANRLSSSVIRFLFQDAEGTLWIGTGAGLNEWRPESESFFSYRPDPHDSWSLSEESLLTMTQDRGGVLWLGTTSMGIDKWNPTLGSVTFYGLGADLTALDEDREGRLWLATRGGGLQALNRSTGEIERYRADLARGASSTDDEVTSLLVAGDGGLWVGTSGAGLRRFQRPGERLDLYRLYRHYRHDPGNEKSIQSGRVTSLYQDRAGHLWVGLWGGGLDRWARSTQNFEHHLHDPNDQRSLSNDRVTDLYEDSDGILWVGTEGGGLNRFDRGEGAFTTYRYDRKTPTSLSHDSVRSVGEDREGRLWIATAGGGLNRWEKSDREAGGGIFRHFSEADGLPSRFVYGVLSDAEGCVWARTRHGLAKLDPSGERFQTFHALDGLGASELGVAAPRLSTTGEILVAGNGGLHAFDPGRMQRNPNPPPVVLTDWMVNHRAARLPELVHAAERIEVGHRARRLSFEVAALDFTEPTKNRFAYKLEGFEDDWVDLGSSHRVSFTNLPPGDFRLRVKAANGDGVWNDEGLAIELVVKPSPWRSGWAFGVYVASLLVLLRFILQAWQKGRERGLEQRARLERRLAARTVELRQMSADLSAANAELTEQNQLLERAAGTDHMSVLRNRRGQIEQAKTDLALETPDCLVLLVEPDRPQRAEVPEAIDALHRRLRDVLNECCREADAILRWSEDSFLVVAANVDRGFGETIAERIRDRISPETLPSPPPRQGRVSIGFALLPFLPQAPTAIGGGEVIAIAKRALEVAKASGGNAWVGIYGTESTPLSGLMDSIQNQLAFLAGEGLVELACSKLEGDQLALQQEEGKPTTVNPFMFST